MTNIILNILNSQVEQLNISHVYKYENIVAPFYLLIKVAHRFVNR